MSGQARFASQAPDLVSAAGLSAILAMSGCHQQPAGRMATSPTRPMLRSFDNRPEHVASARTRGGPFGGGVGGEASVAVCCLRYRSVTVSSARPPPEAGRQANPSMQPVCGAARFLPILGSDSVGTGIGMVGEDLEARGIPKYRKATDMLSGSLLNRPMPSSVVRE